MTIYADQRRAVPSAVSPNTDVDFAYGRNNSPRYDGTVPLDITDTPELLDVIAQRGDVSVKSLGDGDFSDSVGVLRKWSAN